MNIYSCPVGCAFMKTFVFNLCAGNILKNFNLSDKNLFGLADIEIYVPTRRAARALKEEFIAQQQDVFFLPNIIAFSDIDNAVIAQPTIGTTERLLILAKLIYSWKQQIKQQSELSDAIWLAQELATLIDEAYLNKVNWQKLLDIEKDLNADLSEWWQLSNKFLQIATTVFPNLLKEQQLLDIGESMALKFSVKAQQIKKASDKAYIVLGATGAVPCVAEFLQNIATLPNSAIILPALDRDLPTELWEQLEQDKDVNLYGQAQYNYFKLLKKFKISKEQILFLGEAPKELRWRETYVSYALMPAEATYRWYNLDKKYTDIAFENVALIETDEEREEALAIACALRIEAENSNKKVALVTANRNLARRVSVELARFGIVANDSAQQPFFSLPFGRWLELLLLNCTQSDVHIFLSLLKHPISHLGFNKIKLQQMIDLYEKYRLRGAVLRFSFLDIEEINKQMEEQWLTREEDNCNADIIALIDEFIAGIIKAIKPLKLLFNKTQITLKESIEALIETIELWMVNETGDLDKAYKYEGIEEFSKLCQEIVDTNININFSPLNISNIFEALTSIIKTEAKPVYSNIHIWGIIEARLQYADTVILGGLNESQFPLVPKSSIFLSRPMMKQLKLEPSEAQIGATALEFQYLLGMPKVILSRAKLSEGIVLVPSRWLQRLKAVIGQDTAKKMQVKGNNYLEYAKYIDMPEKIIECLPPNCKPPLDARPKNFSISEIEQLQVSPYAIYAKKILKLKPLLDFAKIPSDREKGILYHDIVAEFIRQKGDNELFKKIAKQYCESLHLPIDIALFWLQDLFNISDKFVALNKKIQAVNYIECKAKSVPIGNKGAYLTGRADHIKIVKNNNHYEAVIIDYKTGAPITKTDVENFKKPQLLLEAALVQKKAFRIEEDVKAIQALYYIYLKNDKTIKEDNALKKNANLNELIDKCWEHTINLIESYFDINKAYNAYKEGVKQNANYSPYHHLTRFDEWSR